MWQIHQFSFSKAIFRKSKWTEHDGRQRRSKDVGPSGEEAEPRLVGGRSKGLSRAGGWRRYTGRGSNSIPAVDRKGELIVQHLNFVHVTIVALQWS